MTFGPDDYIELYIDQVNLITETYQNRLSELRGQYKNLWVIPQREEIEVHEVDVTMDMEHIIESHIPENLLDKYNIIKQSLN